jgi:hypothetical protein
MPEQPVQIVCEGATIAGKDQVTLNCEVPFDADAGVYSPQKLYLGPPPGGARERSESASVPEIEILPVQDKNVYPQSAVATVQMNQRQVLQDGAAKVQILLDEMSTRVDDQSAETPELRAYLASVASRAQSELEKSRIRYRSALPAGSKEPILFEDFERRYQAFLVENGDFHEGPVRQSKLLGGHVELAQLQTNQTVIVTPPKLGSSVGPLVSKLAEILEDHVAAFLAIGESGSESFTISLRSSPSGASIEYKRIGEGYTLYSRPTDVEQVPLPYARWTFRFSIGTCQVVRTPDPFIEKNPRLLVNMQNCVKK